MTSGRHRAQLPFTAQLALLTICAVVVPAQLYLAIPLAPELEREFGATPELATWVATAFALSYSVGFLIFPPLADRVGKRRMMVGGCVALAIATAAASQSPTISTLLGTRVAQGLAAATFAPVALVWVTERSPMGRRGGALAVLTTGLLAAGLAGQVFGTAVLSFTDWRAAFVGTSAAYCLLALLLHNTLVDVQVNPTHRLREAYRPLLTLFGKRTLTSVFLVAPTVFGSFVAMYAVLGSHLSSSRPTSSLHLLALEGIGCLGLAAAPTARWWAPRPMTSRTQSMVGFGIAAVALLVQQANSILLVPIAATVLYMAGISLVVPGLVGIIAECAPAERSSAVSVNTFLLFAGAAAFPLAVARLQYHTALAILAAVLLAAVVVIALGSPRRAATQRGRHLSVA